MLAAAPITLQTTAMKSYEQEPSGVLLSPSEKYLVTYRSSEVVYWAITDLETPSNNLKAPSGNIQDLAFSPDGRLLAAATDENQVAIWSFPEGEKKTVLDGRLNKSGFFKSFYGYSHNQVVFSPDGAYLASQDNSSRPLIWETKNFTLCSHLEDPVFDSEYCTMDFSPDSQMLVVAHGHAAVLYHVQLGIKIKSFRVTPKSLAFHHSKKQFAVGLRDRISLFEPKVADEVVFRTKEEDEITSISKIMFSRDGRHLLAVGRSAVSSVRRDILYGWSLSTREIVPYFQFDSLPPGSTDNIKNSLYRIYFVGSDQVALVTKNTKQLILLNLDQSLE